MLFAHEPPQICDAFPEHAEVHPVDSLYEPKLLPQ